jgi:hypothetical protein
LVVGQHRMRVTAMVWIALFRARSPPRLSRCRTVLPLLVSNDGADYAADWDVLAAKLTARTSDRQPPGPTPGH